MLRSLLGMDRIWNDLRLASLRNDNLRIFCEKLAAEASALEQRFGSVHEALREGRIKWCEEECASKEKVLKDKEIELKSLRTSCDEVFQEFDRKTVEVEELQGRAEDAAGRIRLEEERLEGLKELEAGMSREMEWVRRELEAMERLVRRNREELNTGRKELASIRESVAECHRDLEMKKEDMEMMETTLVEWSKEVDSKMEKVTSLENSIEKRKEELNLARSELELERTLLLKHSIELESKKEELYRTEKLISEQAHIITGKEEELQALHESTARSCNEIRLKKKFYRWMFWGVEGQGTVP
ncbi:hypothetical protein MLD38_016433 [Melastoma candidum]|uniref:Uncharacterized protein n=1 Tax=Melastoma candidum TaxID=119954 RepID=A0ACB9RKL3_9MYRT|nr:hypothetical protein MLD38_016433 [Melastoma candidum]